MAPCKAAGTFDILIHVVIPAAVRYDDYQEIRNTGLLCPEIEVHYQKLKTTDTNQRIFNIVSIKAFLFSPALLTPKHIAL